MPANNLPQSLEGIWRPPRHHIAGSPSLTGDSKESDTSTTILTGLFNTRFADDSDGDLSLVRQAVLQGNVADLKGLRERLGDDILTTVYEHGRTLLSYAAETGHLEMVSYLAGELSNPSFQEPKEGGHCLRDELGRTPLFWAAGNGHLPVVEFLLAQDKRPLAMVDINGWTPLEWASRNGHLQVHKCLLSNIFVDPGIVDSPSSQGLSWMEMHGHEKGLLTLLLLDDHCLFENHIRNRGTTIFGADPPPPNDDQTPRATILVFVFSLAVERGWTDLMEFNPAKLLLVGAEKGRADLVEQALSKRDYLRFAFDPWYEPWRERSRHHVHSEGLSAIFLAIRNKHVACLLVLLKDSWNCLGREPAARRLRHAYKDKYTYTWFWSVLGPILVPGNDVLLSLLRTGSGRLDVSAGLNPCDGELPGLGCILGPDFDPNQEDDNGNTLLIHAAAHGEVILVSHLLSIENVDPNVTNHRGETPLNCASIHGFTDVVKLFLGRGNVDPNLTNHEGETPLNCAAIHGFTDVVQLLLGHGDVDPNLQNGKGETALSHAVTNRHPEIVKCLLECEKVLPNLASNSGETPLHLAVGLSDIRAVRALLDIYRARSLDWEQTDSDSRTPFDIASDKFQMHRTYPVRELEVMLEIFFEMDNRFPLTISLCRFCRRLLTRLDDTLNLNGKKIHQVPPGGKRIIHCAPWRFMDKLRQRCEMCQFITHQAGSLTPDQAKHKKVGLLVNGYKTAWLVVRNPEPGEQDDWIKSSRALRFFRPPEELKASQNMGLNNHGTTTSFEDCVRTINHWLDTCTDNSHGSDHKSCSMGNPSLPKRLLKIDLNDLQQIQLVECAQEQREKYAALSHCWGNPKDMDRAKTTRLNYRDRLKSIPFVDLPKSFQDAAGVCCALGIQHLWIDSLCIIQDDPEDWQRESTKMTATYEDAFITLAATSARGCTQGLSLSHEQPLHFSQFSVSRGADLDRLRTQPLYERGWTLQEKMLSRRIVHFADDNLYWICRSQTQAPHGQVLECRSDISQLSRPPGRSGRKIWWEWIRNYSGRKLTKVEDKLPALAGLTRKYEQLTGDRPCVGLWMDDIYFGLMWQPAPCLDASSKHIEFRSQPDIPSWSWASWDGPVVPAIKVFTDLKRKAEITSNSLKLRWEGEELTSRISECELRVVGRLKMIDYRDWMENQGWGQLFEELWRFPKTVFRFDRNMEQPTSHDDDDDDAMNCTLWCLELVESEVFRQSGLVFVGYFLILERMNSSLYGGHRYRRVGVGLHTCDSSNEWFDGDLPMEEVILV